MSKFVGCQGLEFFGNEQAECMLGNEDERARVQANSGLEQINDFCFHKSFPAMILESRLKSGELLNVLARWPDLALFRKSGAYLIPDFRRDNGTITPRPNQGGTYVVNADCSGMLLPNMGGTGAVAIVVVDGGKEVYQMRLDPSNIVLYSVTKKISAGDN